MREVPGGKDPGVRRSGQRAVQEEVQVMCFQEETRRGADMWVVTQDMKHQGKKGHLKEILRKFTGSCVIEHTGPLIKAFSISLHHSARILHMNF